MKKLYSFSIPDLPPSLNAVYKIGRGQLYKDPDVAVFYKVARYTLPRVKDTIQCPIGLSLSFSFANARKLNASDTDNLLKVTFDMFQYFGVIANDKLICFHSVEKAAGEKDNTAGFFFSLNDPDYLKIQKNLRP